MKFSDLFGEYKAPTWMSKFAGKIAKVPKSVFGKIRKHKKDIIFVSATFLLMLLGVFGAKSIIKFIKGRQPVIVDLTANIYSEPKFIEEEDFMKPLVLNFSTDILKSLKSELDEESQLNEKIKITPDIKGKWKWTEFEDKKSYSRISFVPEEEWKINTEYKIAFDKSIASRNQNMKTKELCFYTPSFRADTINSYFTVDDLFPENKYVVCVVSFNFPISSENIDEYIEIKKQKAFAKDFNKNEDHKAYEFTSEISSDKKTVTIRTESIPVPDESFYITAKLHEGIKCKYGEIESECSTSVKIPGLNDFVGINYASVRRIDIGDEKNVPVLEFDTNNFVSTEDFAKYLEVYQLPDDRPEEPGVKKEKNYKWNSIKEISSKVISMSKKIPFKVIEQDLKMMKSCSFVLELYNTNPVFVKVKNGLEFHGGYKSKSDSLLLLSIPDLEKSLKISCEGNIVNLRGSHKIEISSVDIEKINLTVYRMKPGEINHIASMSNGSMRNFDFTSYSFDEENVSEKYIEKISVKNHVPGKVEKTVFDFSKYLSRDASRGLSNGLFIIEVQEDKEDEDTSEYKYNYYWDEYYYADRRFIMVTDLGLIVKKGNEGERDVFVQSIRTGLPVVGASVDLISKNGDTIKHVRTDADGRASLGKIKESKKNLTPVAYTVNYGDDFCFIPYDSNSMYVGFSNFPVAGSYDFEQTDDVKSYIFTDRGIYKPGEKVRLASITKTLSLGKESTGLPCVLQIFSGDSYYNKNKIAFSKDFKVSENGFDEFEIPTTKWHTDSYTAVIKIKESEEKIGICTFKVKNYLPDNLKMDVKIDDGTETKKGWLKPENVMAHIHLENLYGKPADGNKVTGKINLLPGFPSAFLREKFRDYSFGYDSTLSKMYTETIPDSMTDENGNVDLKLSLNKYASSSFAIYLNVTGFGKAQGNSISGDEISGGAEVLVSPLDYMIGWKTNSYLSYIKKDSKVSISLVAVNNNFDAIDLEDVDCSISELKYVSVLTKRNGVFKYASDLKEYPVESQKIKISKSGTDINLPTKNGGEYYLELKKDGKTFTKIYFTVEGVENNTRSLSKTGELSLKLEKEKIRAGENAKVFIKSPYAGNGYIFVERGKVFSCKHFKMSGLTSEQTINIPKELDGKEGNVYISVFIYKDTYSDEIFMNPLCYGAVPLNLAVDKVDDKINLEVPDEIKPNEKLTVKYSSNRKTKIILMAVNEGILSVAKHSSPNPLDFFFEKRAMTTETFTTLNLVMPEYDVAKSTGAFGGGGGFEENFLFNPFKKIETRSVAVWSGILDCSTTKRSYTFDVPSDFNGTLRIMAVSCGESSIGAAEKSVRSASDIVIVPTVLESVNTGDEFDVPVTVTNISDHDMDVDIKIDAGNLFSAVPGQNSFRKTIKANYDASVRFRVKSNGKNGSGSIKIYASTDSEEFTSERVVSVHPETPFNTWNTSGVLTVSKNEEEINVAKDMYKDFSERKIVLSYHPSGLMDMLKKNLDMETYGQTERIISKALSALVFDDSEENKKIVEEAVECINIRASSNHVKNYAGIDNGCNRQLDSYAAFFITEAKERGYVIPGGLEEKLMDILKDNLSSKDFLDRAFSIYVLTRNDTVTTNYIENFLHDKKFAELEDNDKALLLASKRMLGFENEATADMNRLVKSLKDNPTPLIMYLSVKHFSDCVTPSLSWFENILKGSISVKSETAFIMLAASDYSEKMDSISEPKFFVTQIFPKDRGVSSLNLTFEKQKDSFGNTIYVACFDANAESIKIKNAEKNPLFFNVSLSGFEKAARENTSVMEIRREFIKDGKPVQTLNIGDNVEVRITLHSLVNKDLGDMILSDIFPACLKAEESSFDSNKWEKLHVESDRAVMLVKNYSGVEYYTYNARVVSTGEFTVPPIGLECADDNNFVRLMGYESEKLSVKP